MDEGVRIWDWECGIRDAMSGMRDAGCGFGV